MMKMCPLVNYMQGYFLTFLAFKNLTSVTAFLSFLVFLLINITVLKYAEKNFFHKT